MRKPNLFIVGSFKSGTTALYTYLSDHPNIFMSPLKEPFFFAEDFPRMRSINIDALSEYLHLFEAAEPYHKIIGEASAGYLYSSVALARIRQFNPSAKIVVMLRHPVDLVYSFHSQLVFDGDEQESVFEKAWTLQTARQSGKYISHQCKEPQFLQYEEVGKLGRQVQRLLAIFPSEQVMFILFDDFQRKTKAVYESVLSFLEQPPDDRKDFSIVNANKTYTIVWLSFLLQWRPLWLRNTRKWLMRLIGQDTSPTLGIGNLIAKYLVAQTTREPLDEDFRSKLLETFRDDIELLQELTKLNLTSWLEYK